MSADPTPALPSRPSPGAAGAQLGRLYADHSRMVYGICRMLLGDPDEAEDATQQVFLSAYRNLLTGTDVRDPAAWLGTIARNACRRRSVTRMREPLAVADEAITLVSPGVEDAAIGREDAAALYAELGLLPPKQREAVVLRDLYGLRYDEVAKALGTSRPAVEALLFRGRRRLQRRLRPGVAAGILVVPLAVQESIAYAVPGFASTAVPAGALATAAGAPLLAKLAAGGAAIGLAGSAGLVAERSLHDPPTRPAVTAVQPAAAPEEAVAASRPPVASAAPPSPQHASSRPSGERSRGPGDGDGQRGHDGGRGGDGDDEAARAAASADDTADEHGGNSGKRGDGRDEAEERKGSSAEAHEEVDSSGSGGSSGKHGDADAEEHDRDEPDRDERGGGEHDELDTVDELDD